MLSMPWATIAALGLGVLIVPYLLARWAVRRRSWRLGLFLPVWMAVLVVGFEIIRRWALLVPNESGVWPNLLLSGAGTLLGLALVAVPVTFLLSAVRRRWWRAGLAAAYFAVVTAVVAAVWLHSDRQHLDEGQRYTPEGWYLVLLPGNLVAGALLVLGVLLWLAFRALRAAARRLLARLTVSS
jgi:hypothetical protein